MLTNNNNYHTLSLIPSEFWKESFMLVCSTERRRRRRSLVSASVGPQGVSECRQCADRALAHHDYIRPAGNLESAQVTLVKASHSVRVRAAAGLPVPVSHESPPPGDAAATAGGAAYPARLVLVTRTSQPQVSH